MFFIGTNIFGLSRKNIKKLTSSTSNFGDVVSKQIDRAYSKGRAVTRNPLTLGLDWNEVDWCFWEYESGKGIYSVIVPDRFGDYVIFIEFDGEDITGTYTIFENRSL